MHPRAGLAYALQPPEAAISPEEDAVSIDAATSMGATFAQNRQLDAYAVLASFDAIVGLLTGGAAPHLRDRGESVPQP